MRLIKNLFLLVVLATLSTNISAQNNFMLKQRASKNMKSSQFEEALKDYKELLRLDSSYSQAYFDIGTIFLYEYEQYDSADWYLEKSILNEDKDTVIAALYHYGRCLRLQEKPEEALEYFTLFKAAFISDVGKPDEQALNNIDTEIKYCNEAMLITPVEPHIIKVENIGFTINSELSEYTPVFVKADCTLVYNGRYKDSESEKQFGDAQYMENIYYFDLGESVSSLYDQTIDQKQHFAVVSKNKAKNEFIIYHKNKLAYSTIEYGKIQDPQPFPESLTDFYFQPHGMFSVTSDTLIFSAKKTFEDDLNIYFSTIDASGNWSEPVTLGPTINSSYDEDSPLLTTDGKTLYFSSKGHNSSGGYDVFKSEFIEGEWTTATPLPYPINSAGDDIYLDLSPDGEYAYISSNRTKGFGRMDIYAIDFDPLPVFDCEPYENKEIFASFNVADFIEIEALDSFNYAWKFEDGQIKNGQNIERQFNTPGNFPVEISVTNKATGALLNEPISKTLVVENNDFIGFRGTETMIINETSAFDASVTYLEGYDVTSYDWKIDETTLRTHTPIIEHQFENYGLHSITLQVNARDKNDEVVKYCYSMDIDVLEEAIVTLPEDTTSAIDVFTDTTLTSGNDPFQNIDDTYDLIKDNDLNTKRFNIIYFGFDKYRLSDKAKKELDQLISYLNENPEALVIIEGHTDALGEASYNKKLSERRANQAYNYLIENGIPKSKIVRTVSYGEDKPASPNFNADGSDNFNGRKKNRRVEFVLVY